MNKKSLWKLILILAIPCIIGFMPAPAGLSELAWVLFGIYLAAIVGLVIKPFPEPVVLLIAVAASMVVVGNLSDGAFKTTAVLSGYSSGTTWLVFSAFTLSAAFVTTGLGKRIAYLLIGKIGNTTLGLGYVTVFLDLVLAPATPSNTARAGGIVLPIINSVAVALGSEPEKSPRRVGHYLMMSIYMVTKTTSYMFFTAMAGNILALKMINDILHLQISWGGWALAAGLPGIIMLLVTPLVIYTMYPPEIKKVDNKTIAKAGLAELGPMKIREKMLLGVFVLALLGWNPGTEQEIFSMQELIDSFSLDRVSKSGARFQPDKARWFNAQYMHHKTDAELAALYQPVLRSHGIEVSDAVAGKAAGIMKERATFTTDLWDLTSFFFEAPREYEEKQVRKYWKGQNPAILRELRDVLAGIDDFSLENTERIVHAWIEEKGYGMGQVMNTLRLALVGAGKGPGMYDVTSFIGKEECLKRIDNLLTNLKPAIE